jgi:serine/threonine-protein kinase
VTDEVIAGRYTLDERLGTGAMSEVWCATDGELGRRVAIKLLGRDADAARFEREARAAASLGHPNIVQLFDYGTHEGRPYMVLEYLPGGTLEERQEPGAPLPDDETASIARDVAAGLAHAHDRGLVHRDLKPGNILFDGEGRAKIADLGIARMTGEGTLTEAGTVLGTAAYISPEQAAGREATPASDVYSFGVVLFRLLTGRLPFESSQPMELVRMHLQDAPPPVADLRPDAPPRLESLTVAAMAKDPAHRPPNGAALLAELEPAASATTMLAPAAAPASHATQVIPVAAPPPVARRRGVPGSALAIVGTALVLAIAGVAAAVIATQDSSGGGTEIVPIPSLSLPTTRRQTTAAATTAPTTSEAAPATSAATTTAAPPATAATPPPATTRQTTTVPAVPPTTAATQPTPPPVTTAPVPTQSEPPPPTTSTPATTTVP